jgi:hypothetical protein
MANAYSIIHQNRKITDPIDLNFTNQVLSYKQGKYDKNLAEVEQTLAQIGSLNLAKDVDKKHLGDRLNSMLNSVNNSGVLDLSQRGVANDINSAITDVLDDKVLNAYRTTASMNGKMKEMQDLVKKNPELYAKQNADLFNKQIQDYLSNDEVGQEASFQSYIPYNDYNKTVNEGISKWVKDVGVTNYERYITGEDDRMYKVTGETVDPDRLSRAYDTMVTPEMKTQMSIDADYTYRGIPDQQLKSNFDTLKNGEVNHIKKRIALINNNLPDLKGSELNLAKQQIKDLEDSIPKIENQQFDRARNSTNLYMQSYKNGVLDTYGIDRVTKTELTTDVLDYMTKQEKLNKLRLENGTSIMGTQGSRIAGGLSQQSYITTNDVTGTNNNDEIEGEDAMQILQKEAESAENTIVNALMNADWTGQSVSKPKSRKEALKLVRDTLNSGGMSEDGAINLSTSKNTFGGILTPKQVTDYLSSLTNFNEELVSTQNGLEEGLMNVLDMVTTEMAKPNSKININNFLEQSRDAHPHLTKYIEESYKRKLKGEDYTLSNKEKTVLMVDAIDSLNVTGLFLDKIPNNLETQIMATREKLYKTLSTEDKSKFNTTDTVQSSAFGNLLSGAYNVVKGNIDQTLDRMTEGIKRQFNPSGQYSDFYDQEDEAQIAKGREQLSQYGRVYRNNTPFKRRESLNIDSDLGDIQFERDISEPLTDKDGRPVKGNMMSYISKSMQGTLNPNLSSKVSKLPSRTSMLISPNVKDKFDKQVRDNAITAYKQNSGADLEEVEKVQKKRALAVNYDKESRMYTLSFKDLKNMKTGKGAVANLDREAMIQAGLEPIINTIDTRVINYNYDPINNPTVKTFNVSHNIKDSDVKQNALTKVTLEDGFEKQINIKGENKIFKNEFPEIYNTVMSNKKIGISYVPVKGVGFRPMLNLDIDNPKAEKIDLMLPVIQGSFKPNEYVENTPKFLGLAIDNLLNSKDFVYLRNINNSLKK